MGLHGVLQRLFSSAPLTVSYQDRTDSELLALWRERKSLTDAACSTLKAELERRCLTTTEAQPGGKEKAASPGLDLSAYQIAEGLIGPCRSCGVDRWRPATEAEATEARRTLGRLDGEVLVAVCRGCGQTIDYGQTMAALDSIKAAVAGTAVVALRNLNIARRFPLFVEAESDRSSVAPQQCAGCGGTLQRIVLTTGSIYGDPAAWEAYPLAVDGWRCQRCQSFELPASLTPEEISDLQSRATAAARGGSFDEAEYLLRRCVNSWPCFSPPLVNLASVLLDKIKVEQRGACRQPVLHSWASTARDLLARALKAEPPPPSAVHLMLARIESKLGNREAAERLLHDLLSREDLEEELRHQAGALLAENRGGTAADGKA